MEFRTVYPKTISLLGGKRTKISVDKNGVEQLSIVVKKSVEELLKIFSNEGFTHVKFEHKQPFQIGHGLSLKLKKPWEMHIRLLDMKKGLVAIQAEVEVSRDYLQHLFCQRTPVFYEIEMLLKKHQVEYKIWNEKIKKYVHAVFDNYKIQLKTPNFPVFAWKPMVFVIGTIGSLYLLKYILTV
ncbi:MAG: hypothetical protein E6L00_07560 [Thaumarchaeota archaeon]|nr:MAG: hypothetical protein E6L02_06650 [Nitrososphaerota archaeon]TLX80428.1 MAG: hypothetical protein E6L00_07560 [Nitrososphaerota archaeon]